MIHSPHDRLGGTPHIELGIERARHTFNHHHGLLQHHQLRPCAHIEEAGHLEQQVNSRAMEISSAVRLWIGSPMARIAWAKSSTE